MQRCRISYRQSKRWFSFPEKRREQTQSDSKRSDKLSVETGFETISAEVLGERLKSHRNCVLIDVRMPGEFQSVHVQGAVNLPLDSLTAEKVQSACKSSSQIPHVICQGGNRSRKACQKLSDLGVATVNVDGGTAACVAAGLPVVRGKGAISMDRQVRIVAGSLAFLGAMLGWFVHPAFHGLSAFIGAGLVFAGVSDICGMGMLLAKMPWNQTKNALT